MTKVTFRQGPKKRNELRLPILHYVVADDWIQKLGEKAFCAWLRFHTWVDRRSDSEVDKIPYTLESVAKKLEVSKATLYRTIIRPLWEYGLIDLIEYEDTKRKTQKPVNIIVYESPKNEHETKVMPLVKLRDWKKDYGSSAQIYGLKGGRPKTKSDVKEENPNENTPNPDRFKTETVEDNGFKNETVHGFKNETVTDSKMKPNNDTNNDTHDQSKHINDSNNHHHHYNHQEKEVVVVSKEEIEYVLNHIRFHYKDFKQTLTRSQAERLIRACKEYGKDVGDVIENTRSYFLWEKEKKKGKGRPDSLMGALMHGAEFGWEIPEEEAEVSPILENGGQQSELTPCNWVELEQKRLVNSPSE